jgi:hypothetical protein
LDDDRDDALAAVSDLGECAVFVLSGNARRVFV